MVVMIGMMAGPLVAGILADRTGSYQTGFRVLAGCAALGSVDKVRASRFAGGRRSASTRQTTSTRARWRADASDESRVTSGASSASASAMYAAS